MNRIFPAEIAPLSKRILDKIAAVLAIDGLARNPKPLRLRSTLSLGLLFAPGVLFILALYLLKDANPRFDWFNDLSQYPWQFWAIGLFGTIANLGGAGDWLFHKVYVTVGPHEHHSHILALGAGGIVFLLMAAASVISNPLDLLLPVVIALIVTVILICYDEFAFHIRRCKPFETLLHRMLTLGNGAAFLCWMHWLFVAGVNHG
ncbi:MAG: hypothetical protein ABI690_21185 [Chloroflexota bacterium]